MSLFPNEKPSSKIKLDLVKKKAVYISQIKLDGRPKPKVEVKAAPAPVQAPQKRIFDSSSLRPLSEQERLKLFPNGAKSFKELKRKPLAKVKVKSLKDEFKEGILSIHIDMQQTFLKLMLDKGLSPFDARDIIDEIIYAK